MGDIKYPLFGSGTVEVPGPAPDVTPTAPESYADLAESGSYEEAGLAPKSPEVFLAEILQRLNDLETQNVQLRATLSAKENEVEWLRGQLASKFV